jgi:hypothetical protein
MLNNIKYCCEHMRDAVEGEHFAGKPPVVLYTPKWRLYGLVIGGNPDDQFILVYCPFCGKKLPESLWLEHDTFIRDRATGKPFNPIPEEFQTDEWWKKRGL